MAIRRFNKFIAPLWLSSVEFQTLTTMDISVMKFVLVLILSVCSVQSIQWQPGDGGRIRWSWNCDFPGHDIKEVRASVGECGRLCFYTDGCRRYAWTNYEGGTCWLKSAGGIVPFDTDNGACGEVISYDPLALI